MDSIEEHWSASKIRKSLSASCWTGQTSQLPDGMAHGNNSVRTAELRHTLNVAHEHNPIYYFQ